VDPSLIAAEQEVSQPFLEFPERQTRCGVWTAGGNVARELTKEELIDGPEEALDAASTAWLTGQ